MSGLVCVPVHGVTKVLLLNRKGAEADCCMHRAPLPAVPWQQSPPQDSARKLLLGHIIFVQGQRYVIIII